MVQIVVVIMVALVCAAHATHVKMPSHRAMKKELKARGTTLQGKALDEHVQSLLDTSKTAAYGTTHPDTRYGQFNNIRNRMPPPPGVKSHDRHHDLAKGDEPRDPQEL